MSWTQKGSTILGDTNQLYAGWSITSNYAGNIIALGNNSTSYQVKIYKYFTLNGVTNWHPYGTNDGKIITQIKSVTNSISLNSSGNTIAFTMSDNTVYIYRIDTSYIWQLIGTISSLKQGGSFYNVVSLSNDGNAIAIGEPLYRLGDGYNGRASVWTYNGTTWTRKGNYIVGENTALNYAENLGGSLALSGNGNFLVIGSPRVRRVSGYFPGSFAIYNYNGTNWTIIGTAIDAPSNTDNIDGYWGSTVSINDVTDLNDVIVSTSSRTTARNLTQVYKYDSNASSKWTQLGTDISGGLGFLNSTGNKIATQFRAGWSSYSTKTFEYNSITNQWTQYSGTITTSNQSHMISFSKSSSLLIVNSPHYYESPFSITPTNPLSIVNYGRTLVYSTATDTLITDVVNSLSVSLGDTPYQLSPQSNNPQSFNYSSSNVSVATISSTGLITYVGVGTTTIIISQDADSSGLSYGELNLLVTVTKTSPGLSNFTIPTKINGDSSFVITPPTSNSTGSFTYSSSNLSVATISENIITIIGSGTTTITCTQAETTNYSSGVITASFLVNKRTTILSNFSIPTKTYLDPSFVITPPTSNSSGSFTYSSSNLSVATISGNIITIIGVGTTTITCNQEETSEYSSETISTTFEVIDKTTTILSNFSILSKAYGEAPFIITPPTSNSSGSFTYSSSNLSVATISGNIVSIIGVGITTITCTQEETLNYTSETISNTFTVIENTLTTPSEPTTGDALSYFLSSTATYAAIAYDIVVTTELTAETTEKILINPTDALISLYK
jgi:hypothetical protein